MNNWLQYASNIVMFYSLICITYLTPLFFLLHATLETALTHLRSSVRANLKRVTERNETKQKRNETERNDIISFLALVFICV
jgi:hypothetical protein